MSKIFSEMIFKYGYVHCDPHPGNMLVNKTKKGETTLTLLDHGLYQVKIAFFLFLISTREIKLCIASPTPALNISLIILKLQHIFYDYIML